MKTASEIFLTETIEELIEVLEDMYLKVMLKKTEDIRYYLVLDL